MKKTILTLLTITAISAHAESLTVTHSEQNALPQELETAVAEANLTYADITDLTIVSAGGASLSETDIDAIRTNLTQLVNLDLSETSFPSNGWMPNTQFETHKTFCAGMTNLTKVILPENTIRISTGAFNGCTNLTDVNFPEKLTVIEGYAFRQTKVSFHELPSGINWGTTGWTFSACYSMRDFVIPEDMTQIPNAMFYLSGDANTRTITCRQKTPPATTIDLNGYNGSFGNQSSYPNYTLNVLRSCVDTYQTESENVWHTMKVQELANTLFSIVYTNPDKGTVTNYDEPLFDGKIAIYEEKNNLVFTPIEGYILHEVKIDGETIYNSLTSESMEALENLVYPMTRAEGDHILTVTFANPQDVSTVVDEYAGNTAALSIKSGIISSPGDPGITIYDTTGKIITSTLGETLSIEGLQRGIYIVRNSSSSLKISL